MNKIFVRVRTIKDIVIFTSLIIIGITLIILPTGPGINVAAIMMIFAGILFSLILKTGYMDSETGEKYQKTEHYFQQEMNPVISAALKSGPEKIDLSESEKGNSLKLDIYFSRKIGKAYMQLFEYIPYKYEPCSNMYEHPLDKINGLIK